MTGTKFENDNYHKYDLREPPRKIIHPDKIKTVTSEHFTDDWSKIPFYPTIQKKNEMIQKYGKNEAEKIIQYSYDNSTDPTKEILPPQTVFNIPQNVNYIPQNVNKYSPAYARIIAAKPRATASANIRLGGVYR
jgi:hypothetical protein